MDSMDPSGPDLNSPTRISIPVTSPAPSPIPNGRSSRVYSEADEIKILKCLIRATKSIPPPITTVGPPIIDRIIRRFDNKFSLSQINDKLRRLREKYHKQAKNKSLVRTHHDRRLFKLSKRVWGRKIMPRKMNNNNAAAEQVLTGTEKGEGVEDLERFTYLVAEFSRVLPENEVWRDKMMELGEDKLRKMDQEWVFLKVEEAKLVAKKAELIQQQIMEVMGENGSANGV